MSRTEIITTRPESPSVLSRLWGSLRSYMVGPLTSRSPELARYFGAGLSSAAGVSVTERNALHNSAVFAAVSLISDDVSSLPLMLYKRLPTGGKDRYESHPLYRLLHDAPNPEMTSMVFRRTLQAHACIWMNAYAEIERDRAGRPISLWPLTPDRVQVLRDRAGVLFYRVHNDGGGYSDLQAGNMLHLVGQSEDGSVGSTLVAHARESIGLAMAAEKFGATFFGNGMTFGGVVSYPGSKPPELSEQSYVDQLKSRHEGVERAHKLLMLYNGAKYENKGVTPNDGQFLETRVFQIREIARWFKIPPHKLADLADATFSNVEQQNLDYYTSCLRPWLVLWEQELSRKLISPLERSQQFIEHETHGLLKADAAGRAALYTAEFGIGAVQINEIRGFENRDPVDGGDRSFVPLNMIPLDRVDEYIDSLIKPSKGESGPPPTDPEKIVDEVKQALQAVEARMSDHATALSTEAAARAAAEAVAAEKAHAVADLRSEVGAARKELDAAEERYQEALREHRRQMAETKTCMEAAILASAAELGSARETLDAAKAEKNDLDVMLGVAEKERDEAKRAADEAATREREWQAAIDTLNEELEQVRATEATTQALAEELRTQLAAQREAGERLALEHAKAEAARVLAEAQRADKDAALALAEADRIAALKRAEDAGAQELELRVRVEQEQAAAERLLAAIREAESSRAAALEQAGDYQLMANEQEQRAVASEKLAAQADGRLQAIGRAQRALFVDAFERLLQREADRARKAQATPEKLRAWVESFYQTHADTCRSVLRPVVLAWAPCAGVNAETVLSELVQDHIDTSRRDLRMAADTDDPDELAANLARVLRRWETERADAVADRLLAEGDRHGH